MKAFLESNFYLIVREIANGHSQYISNLDPRVVKLAKRALDFVATHNTS